MLNSGHVQSRVVYYLMNIHVLPKTIYLTRVSSRVLYILLTTFDNVCNDFITGEINTLCAFFCLNFRKLISIVIHFWFWVRYLIPMRDKPCMYCSISAPGYKMKIKNMLFETSWSTDCFLMRISFFSVLIYHFFQHGESDMNLSGKIGGDGELSTNGRQVFWVSSLLSSSFYNYSNYFKPFCYLY